MTLHLLRKLWYACQKHREPYKTLWKLRYVLRSLPAHSTGSLYLRNWKVNYLDPIALALMWELQFIRKYNDFFSLTPNPRIIDCGANIGVSVLRYKELFPNCTVTAFEPDPDIYDVLCRNIRENRLQDVEAIKAAIWTNSNEIEFEAFSNGDSQSGRIVRNRGETIASGNRIFINTVWLGDYLRSRVDFLKVDIEGAELEVLESCEDLLVNVDQIMVEVHYRVSQPETLIKIIALMHRAGFKIAIYQLFQIPSTSIPFHSKPDSAGDQFPLLWGWRD